MHARLALLLTSRLMCCAISCNDRQRCFFDISCGCRPSRLCSSPWLLVLQCHVRCILENDARVLRTNFDGFLLHVFALWRVSHLLSTTKCFAGCAYHVDRLDLGCDERSVFARDQYIDRLTLQLLLLLDSSVGGRHVADLFTLYRDRLIGQRAQVNNVALQRVAGVYKSVVAF